MQPSGTIQRRRSWCGKTSRVGYDWTGRRTWKPQRATRVEETTHVEGDNRYELGRTIRKPFLCVLVDV